MKVIRLEHNDGDGIFTHYYKHERKYKKLGLGEIEERHTPSNGFPGPFNDEAFDSVDIQDYHFAYLSLEQLKKGFTEDEIKICISLGFKILMYTLSCDFLVSKYQVIFIKSKATHVEDISSLFL